MINRGQPLEHMRVPELSRKASEYIAAIEVATPESPASLDMLVTGGDIMSTLEARVGEIDELYSRHNELFFENNHIVPWEEVNHDAVRGLSQEILRKADVHDQVYRAAALGLAVLQFAEAGNRAATDPALLITSGYNEQNRAKVISDMAGGLAGDAFEAFQDRTQGDMLSLPRVRLGYLGCLMSTHYDFWSNVVSGRLADEQTQDKAAQQLSLFPSKVTMFDIHSSYGRPPQDIARNDLYIEPMKRFEKTLIPGGGKAWNPNGNITDAMPFLLGVANLAMARGYSADESLQIAAHNTSVIGRLTERRLEGLPIDSWDQDWIAMISEGALRFEADNNELPRLVIEPRLVPEDLSAAQTPAPQQVRSQKTGNCVARSPVLLRQNGTTHQNILTFSTAMKEYIGIEPPVLREAGGDVYVDPAALTVCYTLFALAVNYSPTK